MKIQQITIWLLAASVIIVGFFFFNKNGLQILQSNNNTSTSVSPVTGIGAFDEEGNPIEINVLPIDLPPAPDISGTIVFPSNFKAEDKMVIIEHIESLRTILGNNPADVDSWIELGSYWRLIEDYKRAEEAWLYASEINTASPVPLGNLGFLYGYFLHNNTKAEQYYRQAIDRSPDQEYLYFQLSDFFRDVVRDISKAQAVAEEGVAANPKNENLKALRDSLK